MSQWTLKKDKTPGIIALIILTLIAGFIGLPKYTEWKTGILQYKSANKRIADGFSEEAIKDLNDLTQIST